MKKSIKIALAGLLLVPVVAFGVVAAQGDVVNAATTSGGTNLSSGLNAAHGTGTPGSISTTGNDSTVKKVVDFLLYIVGILSVIMLIWGGIRYTTSAGDAGKVTSAKNTILYALIGLIVAVLAYAIVQFVFSQASGLGGSK